MDDDKPSARADLISAVLWIVLGGAIFIISWTMDRLENLHINPYTAPGLVPGILGASLVLMGVILLVRAWRAGGLASGDVAAADDPDARDMTMRVIMALVLCLTFGAGLVGRGLPFWAATLLFVFVFITAFQWRERTTRQERVRGALLALAVAVGTAVFVTVVFQEIFLVQLP